MKREVQQFIECYYDKERHIFNYFKNYMSCYIHLDDVIVMGPLEERPKTWSGPYIENRMIIVSMFMKGGGVYIHTVKEGRDAEISELDRDMYEALRQCWLECKKPE